MPLHTDDPAASGNIDDSTYFREMAELAARVGDAGLHVVPADELDAAYRRIEAAS